jgi:hypothetical protein
MLDLYSFRPMGLDVVLGMRARRNFSGLWRFLRCYRRTSLRTRLSLSVAKFGRSLQLLIFKLGGVRQ